MEISLKRLNQPLLILIVVANILLYFVFFTGSDFNTFIDLLKSWENYVPATAIAIIVGILNSQLDHIAKARLVFWKWSNPLPGCVAFSEIMNTDNRIDPKRLQEFNNPLPIKPEEQNRLWYKWYRDFQNEAGVKQVHEEYLFARDWAGLTILFIFTFVPMAFYQMDYKQALWLLSIRLLQYLMVRWSARNHGRRFVASVLACKSAT